MNVREQSTQFCDAIWNWYSVHKRELPWRDLPDADVQIRAYKIWISEVMLQQTQVARVTIKWQQWLQVFPTVAVLAKASNKDVIVAWEGMGYNSRALRLRDTAKLICTMHAGMFPVTYEGLRTLPGIGPYTAAAICNFAYSIQVACIDTNIRRILHRTFYGPEDCYGNWEVGDKQILALADDLLQCALNKKFVQKYHSDWQSAPCAEWHAALMDFGSMVCTKRSPKWSICPLTQLGICKAAHAVPKLVRKPSTEPGRMIGATFVPNRIIRGKIVQLLRESTKPQSLQTIGKEVCIDWSNEHLPWLQGILKSLQKDSIIQEVSKHFVLQD
jgi:A/G-specific adenine glycosylase